MMKINNSFFNGPLVKTRRDDNGNNGILFRAYLDYWTEKNRCYCFDNDKIFDITLDKERPGYFKANPPEQTEHFSIDNMTGLYAEAKLYRPELIKELPVFKWNHKTDEGLDIWWHPNGWMIFLGMKSTFFKYFFYPFILCMALFSAKRPKESTTGKNLWWLRSEMLDLPSITNLMEKLKVSFQHSFNYYFTNGGRWTDNSDHPVTIEVNKFYKD